MNVQELIDILNLIPESERKKKVELNFYDEVHNIYWTIPLSYLSYRGPTLQLK